MSSKIVTYRIDSILLGKMVYDEFRVEYNRLLDDKTLTIVYDMIPYNDSSYIVKGNNDNIRMDYILARMIVCRFCILLMLWMVLIII